jgi:GR25 family glycosyltransferase involved in LPS biosynthesis
MTDFNLDKLFQEYKHNIQTGADAKQLQYEYFAEDRCYNNINLTQILTNQYFQVTDTIPYNNCVMINILKDTVRYHSAIKELEKLSISQFVHLKATYWKHKTDMLTDLKLILSFLSNFNPNINKNTIEQLYINDFSETNDACIKIQDGPLGCYISHLRAMMYGYLNFKEYTIIIEDDIFISNTEKIQKYIKDIPNDWDVILLNSVPLHTSYGDQPVYKLTNLFHSAHFYIIKNSAMPLIFQHMYPIFDQVDLLLANLYNKLNIYNITDTVYQKNFSTNTQNNLNAILNGISYRPIRRYMLSIRNYINEYIDIMIPDNTNGRNQILTSNIYSDVIYNHIINNYTYNNSNYVSNDKPDVIIRKYENEDTHINEPAFQAKNSFFKNIYHDLYILLNCVVKGKNIHNETFILTEQICQLVESFNLHNTIDDQFNEPLKAYSYGSTSNIYLLENSGVIIKVYNKYLRWECPYHNNIDHIFEREINHLTKLAMIINIDCPNKIIKMKYLGESLYNNFVLPTNWKEQIIHHFNIMNSNNITYPEFNLKNILVLNDTLNFIDYGLSGNNYINLCNNHTHDDCSTFITLIEQIQHKYNEIDNKNNLLCDDENLLLNKPEMKKIYYKNFIMNLILQNKHSHNIF